MQPLSDRHPPCRTSGGSTQGATAPPPPAPARTARCPQPAPPRAAGLREAWEQRGGEGGREGRVQASAGRGGLLVHYKITKNKWKQLRGSRVNKVNETKLAAISAGARARTPRSPARGLEPGGSEQPTKASGRSPVRPRGLPSSEGAAGGTGPPEPCAPQVHPHAGPGGRCWSAAGLAFPALPGRRCKLSDNAERRGFCADEIIDSY